MMPPVSRCSPFRALSWPAKANIVVLGAVAVAFSVLLWPEWRHDENLTHAIFIPFLVAILFVESRRDPEPRFLDKGAGLTLSFWATILAGLASLGVAFVYGTALGWAHAMAESLLSIALVCLLGAAWLSLADNRQRFIPFNWAAAVAVGLWLFASPPPPGSYARLTFFLQTQVTNGVVRVLNDVGIAAYQDGNVIELAKTSVGVSEACSGVRSLFSCTAAGLFLSALLVRRLRYRVILVVLAPCIGLAMNFLRSLLLTLLANSGVSIEGRWHDLTGACILIGTTLLLAALALWLNRREPKLQQGGESGAQPSPSHSPLQAVFAVILLSVAAVTGLFFLASEPYREISDVRPDLEALLPAPDKGWTARTTPDLERYYDVLHTHALIERVYSSGPLIGNAHVTLYLAYWKPGEAPVSLVDSHTPDACWPGSGWEARPEPNSRQILSIGDRVLPPAECRLFRHDAFETHVWFWHLYGGKPLTIIDPYSVTRILKITFRYGFVRPEDQLFVRISSNRTWDEISSHPELRQFFANLRSLGL